MLDLKSLYPDATWVRGGRGLKVTHLSDGTFRAECPCGETWEFESPKLEGEEVESMCPGKCGRGLTVMWNRG